MKIKLDENLPGSLAEILSQYGHETTTVTQEGLAGYDDDQVFSIAKSEKCLFITLDLDFSDIRKYPPGTHPGIIIVRPKSKGRNTVLNIFRSILKKVTIKSFEGTLAIVDEMRIRIRRK